MKIEDALPLAQNCGGMLMPKTETHFRLMMAPTAKRHMSDAGRVCYQGHKWQDALTRIPEDRRGAFDRRIDYRYRLSVNHDYRIACVQRVRICYRSRDYLLPARVAFPTAGDYCCQREAVAAPE